MKRKIIKHGPATHIISLPASWIRKNRLKKGDEIDLFQNSNDLIVSTDSKKLYVELTVDVTNLHPRLVDRFLARSYQKGYDKLTITHNNLVLLKTLQQKVLELIGFEIIEQDSKRCVIKSITNNIDLDFDSSLKRAFQLVKAMGRSCEQFYDDELAGELKNISITDLEVNRLCYFCLRQLNKDIIGHEFAHQKHVLYYLIESLEDLGDSLKKAASLLSLNKKQISILKILKILNNMIDESFSFFVSPAKEKANSAYEKFLMIQDSIRETLGKKLPKEQLLAIISLSEAANISYHFTTMRLDCI